VEPDVRHCIRVDEIPAAGMDFAVDHATPVFAELLADALDGKRPRAFHAAVTVRKEETRIFIDGTLELALDLVCARCLAEVSFQTRSAIQAVLLTEEIEPDDESLEIEGSQLDESFLEGDEVDLAELIREQALLVMPDKALCRDDCKGICPGCGAELNDEACTCTVTAVDPRMAALADLKIEDEN
jgi:uncharacterized protein